MPVERTHSEALAKRLLTQYHKQLDDEFREQRDNAAERLWNALMAVMLVEQPSIETSLYVLEMLKFQLLTQQTQVNLVPSKQVESIKIGNVAELRQIINDSRNGRSAELDSVE